MILESTKLLVFSHPTGGDMEAYKVSLSDLTKMIKPVK